MGASGNGALLLVGLTAASPAVIFLSTNLLPESLFALLATAALLTLLEERALLAGVFAGLAALTKTAGAALIVACILTLVVRRRFRSAGIFAAVAMAIVAPWLGWSLAHVTHDRPSNDMASSIFTGLAASEKLIVVGHNLLSLLASPFSLLTGLSNALAVVATIVVLVWCFFVRRQLVPDLFIALYCVVLLCQVAPLEGSVAPILPLVLWIAWRVLCLVQVPEALAAFALIAALIPLWEDATRILPARASGYFAVEAPANNWYEMGKLFGFIRANTPPNSIVLANLDSTFFLNTERKTIRGFTPNGFDLFYAPRQSAVTPDQLSRAIVRAQIGYVVLTPDRGLPESASFHKSVEALER
jgi:hypothetical protein